MNWNGLAGNSAVKEMLSGYVDSGRFPHALLLEGPVGSGRRSFARWMARAAVCLAESGGKPCGGCAGCHKAEAGTHPDIQEIEGEGKSHIIPVDVIRSLREQAYIRPNEAPRRTIIITGSEDMNEAAQNALLKVLEEPPAHVVFILTCENRSQMLSTIQSRALCVTLSGVEEDEGWPVVCRHLPGQSEEDARRALRLFGGSIGRAIEGLQGGHLIDVIDQTAALAEALVLPNELPLLQLAAGMDKSIWDGVLRGLQLAARDALAGGVQAVAPQSPSPKATACLAGGLTRPQLMALVDTVEELVRSRQRHMNPTLFSVVAAARLRQAAGK